MLLALPLAAFSATAAAVGRTSPSLLSSAYRGACVTAALVTLAGLTLALLLLNHDFGLRYVAENTSLSMDAPALLSAFWGGQSGSLLFWAWGQSLLTVLVLWRNRCRYPALMPVVVATLLGIQAFFLFVVAMVSNPFERVPIGPSDGNGLNPLLLDAGMRIHPPLLLTGYMSFSVPFAFAVAALVTGDLGRTWLQAIRRWTVLAWAIQGAGLLMGAWWAYHVLGWGGYWGWDPVENVALLPWLTATALLHSIMVQERRGMLKVWNLGLAAGTFVLAVFGTFVVRSGVLSSVHSFAVSEIGPYFFGFLAVVLLGTGGLTLFRLPALRAEGRFDALLSREVGFLANNWLLLAVGAATFWGTIFPLVSEAFQGVKVAIGPQFYRQVNGPIFLVLLVLMGVGPLLAWRRTSGASLTRNFRWPVALGLATALVLLLFLGMALAWAAFAYAVCAFVAGAILLEFVRGVRARRRSGRNRSTTREQAGGQAGNPVRAGMGAAPVQGALEIVAALSKLVAANRRRYGGYLVHLGVVLAALGVIGSGFFQQVEDVTLRQGESLALGRYTITYERLSDYREPSFDATAATLTVRGAQGESPSTTLVLRPERRTYENWETQPVTGVAIGTTLPWLDDVYVLLTQWDEQSGASFRFFLNPLVPLIWAGGVLLLAGTVVAIWPVPVPRPMRRAVHEARAQVQVMPPVVPGVEGSLADA